MAPSISSFPPNLKIYRSSAGSGKTYTLVFEYLSIVLKDPKAYKQVLAITFTKKAAAEMKERILRALQEIRDGKADELVKALRQDPHLKEIDLPLRSAAVLSAILHDYANFSVSTIDSFTYRIVQSFAKDLDLPSRFDVETDTRGLITRLTDLLLDSIGRDEYVTEVLLRFAESKVEEESGWNIEADLKDIAQMIFKEESRDPVEELQGIEDDKFLSFIGFLKKEKERYPGKMKALGQKAIDLIASNGLSKDDFYYGKSGPISTFYKLAAAEAPRDFTYAMTGGRFQSALESGTWAKKTSPKADQVDALMQEAGAAVLTDIMQWHDAEFQQFATSWFAYRNIYSLGVLKQMEQILEAYKTENSVLHISDFNRKISEFVQEEPAEYIYWRLGDQFRHYLLDEFQDTSRKQWENLLPLLENVRAGSEDPSTLLLVGDSKQAIYRWRSGDIELLETVAPDFMGVSPHQLSTNYRSKAAIVNFNNQLFEGIREVFPENPYINQIYSNFKQDVRSGFETGGLVRLELLEKAGNSNADWKEAALDKSLELIQEMLTQGFEYADIAILVRTGGQGSEVAQFLSEANIPVISSDSLFLYKDPRVNFLLSLFRFLTAPYHRIARAEVMHTYKIYLEGKEYLTEEEAKLRELLSPPEDEEAPLADLAEALPEGFRDIRGRLDQLPLYELTEELVRVFKLNASPSAYLQHFLDAVQHFSERREPDVTGFLEYWDEKRDSYSLQVPEGENAIRILTIHKSKGLQFPVVMMPFTDWSATPKTNSNMWAEAGGAFKEFGDTFLLGFTNDLEASHFNPGYAEEVSKSYLDNVNLLYVALTRPEERLYIFLPKPKKKKPEIKSVADMVIKALETAPVQSVISSVDGQVYEMGMPVPRKVEKEESLARFAKALPSTAWRTKLRISRNFERFWEASQEPSQALLAPEKIIVEALRRLPHAGELPRILQQLSEQGLMAQAQSEAIQTRLQTLLASSPLRDWFQIATPARTAPELLRPTGGVAKADRLIRKGNQVIALLFASQPNEQEKMTKKLAFFIRTLEEMGYEDVIGEVIVVG